MAQYIDKDALVAEVERRIKSTNNDVKIGAIESFTVSKTLNSLISFINTLEVKEVDLENEIDDWYNTMGIPITTDALKETARHFFELGIKAQKGE